MPQIGDNQMAKAYIGGLQMNGTSDEPSDYVVYGLKMDEWDSANTTFSGISQYVSKVNIPSGVTTFGEDALKGYGVESFEIPTGVTTLGKGALRGMTNLKSITIPSSVQSMGQQLFAGDTSLSSITFNNSFSQVPDLFFSGCTALSGVTLPQDIWEMGKGIFKDCTSLVTHTMPEYFDVMDAGSESDPGMFEGCTSLTGVTWGEYAPRMLPANMFKGCTSFVQSSGPIGKWAYRGCTSLTSFTLGDYDINNVEGAFRDSGLKNVTFTRSTSCTSSGNMNFQQIYLGKDMFYGCQELSAVTVSADTSQCDCGSPCLWAFDGVEENCFLGNRKLTSLPLPIISNIGEGAFQGCTAMTSVSLSGGTKIEKFAFGNCGLTSIATPSTMVSICEGAFQGCPLTAITFNEGLKYLGTQMFGNFMAKDTCLVTAVTIPSTVIDMSYNGDYGTVFDYWRRLKEVTMLPTVPPSVLAFEISPSYHPTLTHIYVPAESVDAYKAATNWSVYANIIEAIPAT